MTWTSTPFTFICPDTGQPLKTLDAERQIRADGFVYHRVDGIWRFMLPGREEDLAQFMQEYETVRRAEGRGSLDAAWYRALPYTDLSGTMEDAWRIRALSFDALVEKVLPGIPIGGRVLDMGSGNGWLAGRLATLGYAVAAVDLSADRLDGLGAYVHYQKPFVPIQAEFERLPLATGEWDLVIFNASLHYSTDYETTLRESLRVLKPDGILIAMDTPIYRQHASGEQMVAEREDIFRSQYGFASNSLPNENFLTWKRWDSLMTDLGLTSVKIRPNYSLKWQLRPLKAKLRGRREPATFCLLKAER